MPDEASCLYGEGKSGFNPFYSVPTATEEDEEKTANAEISQKSISEESQKE